MEIRGKNIIVTGGVRGLGRAIVDKLIAKSAAVTVFDYDLAGLDQLSQQQSGVNCVACDVSDHEQVIKATNQYHEKFGAADILINNAGILSSQSLIKITPEGVVRHDAELWNRVLAADLSSVFYMTSCIVEKMIAARTRGVIVNISSVCAAGTPGASAYAAAKAGVNSLTASWAGELGPLGIRVVAVAPGYLDNQSTYEAMSEAALRERLKRVPLGRLGKLDEIAEGVLSVIQNDFFNGKVFELDGGLII